MLVGISVVQPVDKPAGLDVGEPFAPYSQDVGLLPLPNGRLEKARQWCRALQRQVRATWWAAVETDTHLAPGAVVHREAEAVRVEAGLTVAAVQALYEIFYDAFPRPPSGGIGTSPFEVLAHGDDRGRVASGLKLIRNGEMHADCIIAPDIARVVQVPFTDGDVGFRVFPEWIPYAGLPTEIREARHPPKRSQPLGDLKTNELHHQHYRDFVAGRPVVETFLDCLAFFASCDPRIVRRDAAGDYRHFPLEPIVERDYERRHPDALSRREVEAELRGLLQAGPPIGVRRIVLGRMVTPDGRTVMYGMTEVDHGRSASFTEFEDQVVRDIAEHDFPYWVESQGTAHRLVLGPPGDLIVSADDSFESALAERWLESHWEDWHEQCERDAFYYCDQRRRP